MTGLGFALACAASLAARELVNRAIPREVPSLLIATVTTLAVTLAGATTAVFEARTSAGTRFFEWIAAAAFVTAIGNSAVVAASRRADLSVVAPFRFSNIVWALLLGYVMWHEMPGWQAVAGILLIVAAGVYVLRSTRRTQGSVP
jgi:drug/metabolite transporter (DMT)-like permease